MPAPPPARGGRRVAERLGRAAEAAGLATRGFIEHLAGKRTPQLPNPRYSVLACERITGRGAGREVRHLEISLAGSGLTCRPADALDGIARRYANGSLRLTTRQAFQFHGVVKSELKETMAAINGTLIDTIAACGDVNRNVLARGPARHARAARPARGRRTRRGDRVPGAADRGRSGCARRDAALVRRAAAAVAGAATRRLSPLTRAPTPPRRTARGRGPGSTGSCRRRSRHGPRTSGPARC